MVVTYLIQDKEDERRYEAATYKIIDCAHGVVPEGFEEMEFRVYESGKTVPETILFPQDTDNWKELSLEDIKAVPNDDLYAEGIGEFFSQSETEAKTVSTGYSVFAQRSTKTFSVFNTDMCITYIDDIPAANGKHIRLFMFYSLKDCLQVYRRDFFKSMLWYYLGFALFFALLAWYNYRRFYSLQGKNRFHRRAVKIIRLRIIVCRHADQYEVRIPVSRCPVNGSLQRQLPFPVFSLRQELFNIVVLNR